MDTQIKKGLLDVCILKLLSIEDSYGYKIIEDLKEVISISESTLYPILKRLEEGKYLQTYNEEHQGRQRKYYKITKSGLKRLKDFDVGSLRKIMDFILGGIKDE